MYCSYESPSTGQLNDSAMHRPFNIHCTVDTILLKSLKLKLRLQSYCEFESGKKKHIGYTISR